MCSRLHDRQMCDTVLATKEIRMWPIKRILAVKCAWIPRKLRRFWTPRSNWLPNPTQQVLRNMQYLSRDMGQCDYSHMTRALLPWIAPSRSDKTCSCFVTEMPSRPTPEIRCTHLCLSTATTTVPALTYPSEIFNRAPFEPSHGMISQMDDCRSSGTQKMSHNQKQKLPMVPNATWVRFR